MKTSVIGFPRIGSLRELKFASEKYFKKELSAPSLNELGKELRQTHWMNQHEAGIDLIPCNDFSFYDLFLDTACLCNIIPQRYLDLGLSPLDTYFAMARGYQGGHGDVKALAMKKWFHTNYHYMVAELEDTTQIRLQSAKLLQECQEAIALGIQAKPVVIGPFTLVKLLRYTGTKTAIDIEQQIIDVYCALLQQLQVLDITWIQLDEPYLVYDLTQEDIAFFHKIYQQVLDQKGNVKVLLQTYFGDVRDCYSSIISLAFDGIGLDFVEGKANISCMKRYGFPQDKTLFAGLVNGKNIWCNHYASTLDLYRELSVYTPTIILSTSCSLQHVPYTLAHETTLSQSYKKHFAFAIEKLEELQELKQILEAAKPEQHPLYLRNQSLFQEPRDCHDPKVTARLSAIQQKDFIRLPAFSEREKVQQAVYKLPLLPTTTIGSFPQSKEIKVNRNAFKTGKISEETYVHFIQENIKECIKFQESIGLDVLVHGEFERNDMVEYFGECLDGYLFTEKAWVQSYGTRCVKPPIIWGDISRSKSMSVAWACFAQGLSEKPVKGMLTGPVTILNWSFPREDISHQECAYQIALAIRDEVLDLEANGIHIIQIDEAALREKLPLRKKEWNTAYLDWAIPAFRLVHSGVKAETQIHTHMCYSEFTDIITAIDEMDADVITFEASRSDLMLLDALQINHFQTAVGPGVYDIHSPRIPSIEEIKETIQCMIDKLSIEKLWINPDCGLKTRNATEAAPSLIHMMEAVNDLRTHLHK